jgi:hypothetical protein
MKVSNCLPITKADLKHYQPYLEQLRSLVAQAKGRGNSDSGSKTPVDQCQHENPAGSSFCLECGARLRLTCGSCGADLPAGSKFCNRCGTAPERITEIRKKEQQSRQKIAAIGASTSAKAQPEGTATQGAKVQQWIEKMQRAAEKMQRAGEQMQQTGKNMQRTGNRMMWSSFKSLLYAVFVLPILLFALVAMFLGLWGLLKRLLGF